jgi:hypothetical protein
MYICTDVWQRVNKAARRNQCRVPPTTRPGLGDALRGFLQAWPARFRARFGDTTPVASRVLTTFGPGSELRAMRERLGRSLAPLKSRPAPGPEGMLVAI